MKVAARFLATIFAVSVTPTCLIYAAAPASAAEVHAKGNGAEAQTGPASSGPTRKSKRQPTPKVELFLGYTHFRGVPTLSTGNRMVGLNGGTTSLAFNFNRYIGLVGDFGGYHATQLRLAGPGAVPERIADANGTAFTYSGGPRISFRNSSRFTPFVQGLFGGIHASEVTLNGCSGTGCTPLPMQNAFAMTAGAGLDIGLTRHLSLRAVQAEYMMTRFAALTAGDPTQQNDLRLSTGLVFRFGGGRPLPPPMNGAPTSTCSVESKMLYVGTGDSVMVHAEASDPDNDPLLYAWTSNAGMVQGSGADVQWSSTGVAAGSYQVSVHVSDGRGGATDCSTQVHVDPQPNQVPALSCVVDRAAVAAGESVQLTATATDPDNDPLTYAWNTTGGRLFGTGASVRLDTTDLATNRYVVSGQVSDGRGGAAECSVIVDVQAPTALEMKLALHSIYFPTARPAAAVPNGGLVASQKQILMELASDFQHYLTTRPDAHLILEGHADPRGSDSYNQALSDRRVRSTKQFLVGRGVAADAIEIKADGERENLTDTQVKDAVERNTELSAGDKQKMLENLTTIILASNRRVDITLSTTGQRSMRRFPFNASDSMSLLRKDATGSAVTAKKK